MMKLTTIPTLQTTGMELTSTGVIFNHSVRPDYETLESMIGQIGRMTRSAQFCLGDLINYAEHEYGKKYDEWIELTDMSYQTLRDIASVAKNIPLSSRDDNLDYTHHRIIAKKVNTDEGRRKWIETATKQNLTTRELEASLKSGKVTTNADIEREKAKSEKDRATRSPEPYSVTVLKLSRWVEDVETKHGTVDTWNSEVRAEFRQQFHTLQQFMERLYR